MSQSKSMTQASATDETEDLAEMLFDHIEAQVNRADTKAGLILAADTLFATTIATMSKGVVAALFAPAFAPLERLSALLTILMFVAVFVSAVYALIIARPVLRLPKRERKLYFFGRIVEFNAPDFIDAFSKQTVKQAREGLLNEVYTLAVIANRKFLRLQRSFDFLIAALVLWAMIQVIMAVM
ncbi:MAG: hypothetical protein HY868_17515 [Chloroflexi bacterium]|nr:hypothetical protein [Chloroflexota bacterium]